MPRDDEDLLELDDEDDDLEDEEDDDADETLATAGDEEGSDSSSLEELLAQRAAARRAAGDSDDEVADILALSPETEPTESVEPLPSKIAPIKDTQEFVCSRCYLVKPRVQLADAERRLCRDCV